MLAVENLHKAYAGRPALRGVQFSLQPGEVYALLGPNGAGKTTLVNILCHLLKPDQGHVWLQGQPLSNRNRCWLGVVPQENLLYRHLTCGENLDFFARLYGVPAPLRPQRIRSCLQQVGLGARQHSVAHTLSGGMLRRLSIAIALVHQPKVLILDEPTAGLDVEARFEVWELLNTCRQSGMTLLMTTHLLEEAERVCQRIGILYQGRLEAEGSLDELRPLIPAREVVHIQTPDELGVQDRAVHLGLTQRRYSQGLSFWLPEVLTLEAILAQFQGLPITSIARQPVQLEHIYLEVTRQSRA
ncbi:MAG: ABC transporter ATP-binding protein [Gloeomargaritaceae cyanobacterium C42_A2020_066]|nr:ABC transporter ATP-binding protein [Gloeomargaritaceae cyanobacterium C42_A2020_066]